MSYFTQLLQNPLPFGQKYPIMTLIQEVVSPQSNSTLQSSSTSVPAYEVRKHSRAGYYTLRDDVSSGTLCLLPTNSTDPNGKYCYWLPWTPDGILKLELRPWESMPESPDIFFTATLDGCSVFFEGDPHYPVVYHANAQSISGPTAKPKTKKQFKQRYESTGACMRSMHETLSLEEGLHELFLDASVRFAEREIKKIAPTSVSPMDYLGVEYAPTWGTVIPVKNRSLRSKVESTRKYTIEIESKSGLVFGVRQNNLWKFYLQKQASVAIFHWNYYENFDSFGKLRTIGSYLNPVDYYKWAFSTKSRYKSYQIPMSCEEVWPSGAGQVMI